MLFVQYNDPVNNCIIAGSTGNGRLLPWVSSLALTKEDELVLLSGGWLSANHISAIHKLLRKQFPTQEGLNDTSLLLEKCSWPSQPNGCVQIIHVSGNHWACLSNSFCGDGEIDLYDSYHTTPNQSNGILKQACTILRSERSSITVNVINVQKQRSSSDCGLYAAAMALDLCNGVDPFEHSYQQSQMREHLKCCFEKIQLTRFQLATNSSECRQIRVVEEVTVEVFCICRLPEKPPMACCESCGTWYHQGCINIPDDVFSDDDVTWICEICTSFLFCVHCRKVYTLLVHTCTCLYT